MSTTPKKTYKLGTFMRSIHLTHTFDVLDEFQSLLEFAWSQSEKRLREEYEGMTAYGFENEHAITDFRSFLEDDFHQLGEVKKLGDALAISALYRQVETQIRRVVGSTFPDANNKKKDKILLGKAVPEIDCSKLPGFDALNELRMLNNCIKHAGSKADAKLASAYPAWIENEELADLNKAYARLKPLAHQYLRAFIDEAYDRSSAFEASPAK